MNVGQIVSIDMPFGAVIDYYIRNHEDCPWQKNKFVLNCQSDARLLND